MGKSTFLYLLGIITTSDKAALSAIDYVTALLVTESCETLQAIVSKCIQDVSEKNVLGELIEITQNFLKNQCGSHFERDDNDCFHGLTYGLGKGGEDHENFTCGACKYPEFTCSEIEKAVENAEVANEILEDVKHVIKGTNEKYIIYMAHKCRVQFQKIAINKRVLEVEDICNNTDGKDTRGMLFLYFKMKFNPVSGRETRLDHYGKHGIGWHGCQVT